MHVLSRRNGKVPCSHLILLKYLLSVAHAPLGWLARRDDRYCDHLNATSLDSVTI